MYIKQIILELSTIAIKATRPPFGSGFESLFPPLKGSTLIKGSIHYLNAISAGFRIKTIKLVLLVIART